MSLFFQTLRFQISLLVASAWIVNGMSLAAAEIDFEKEIRPIFVNHCLPCHDEENEEGGFLIDRDSVLDYVIPEDADGSDLVTQYLVPEDEDMLMPPADAEKPLSEEQITLVKNWINEGASWPEGVLIEADGSEKASTEEPSDVDPVVDDAAGAVTAQQLKNASGSLHPAAVHLPIGLLLAAGLFAFLSLRGNFVMSDCAYYCLWVGALGAIGACMTGWFYSPMEHQGDVAVISDLWDTTQDVFMHRAGGLICSAVALLLALMAMSTRARDPDDGMLWKLGTIMLAAAIGWVGHEGGELTYGKSHYKDLDAVIGSVIPAWNDMGDAEAGPVDESDEDSENAQPAEPKDGEDEDEVELDSADGV